jgi:hypothetical protein
MRFSDLVEQADFIDELRAEDARNQLTAAAFVGWQAGAGAKKSFGEYLKSVGLSEKAIPLTEEQKKAIAQAAKNKAEKIVKKDRKRKRKKKRK